MAGCRANATGVVVSHGINLGGVDSPAFADPDFTNQLGLRTEPLLVGSMKTVGLQFAMPTHVSPGFRAALSLLLLVGVGACAPFAGPEDSFVEHASLVQLVSKPTAYHGNRVAVSGYARIQFENDVLCPQRETASSKDCIWLNYDDGPYVSETDMARYEGAEERWRLYDGKRIRVVGTFDARDTGHLGSTSGGIHHITDVSAL